MSTARLLPWLLALALIEVSPARGADALRAGRLTQHRLIRQAEQLAEAGALTESTALLTHLVEAPRSSHNNRDAVRRARRLLATNYYESGAHDEAIRHAKAVLPEQSELGSTAGPGLLEHAVDCHVLLARAYGDQRLRDLSEVHRGAAVELFGRLSDEPSIRRLRQRVQLLGLQQLQNEQEPNVSDAAPDFTRFPEEHYVRSVRAWVEGLCERNQHAAAAAVLDRIGIADAQVTQSIGFRGLAELHGLRMTAIAEADRATVATGRIDDAAIAARRFLDSWKRDLARRTRAAGAVGIADLQELTDLTSLEADWCERRASDLMNRTPPEPGASQAVWAQAAETLGRLRRLVGLLNDRAERLEWADVESSRREAVQHFAEQRLDRALAGYQRVLLHQQDQPGTVASLAHGLLDEVSTELVELRGRRLLPEDPRTLQAECSRAFALAAKGSHDRAITAFRRALQRLATGNAANRFARAQTSLGLGMSLLASHRLAEAGAHLAEARALAEELPAESQQAERLDQQSDAALGYLAMLQGEYRTASDRLTRLAEADSSAAASENDSVRSTAKVFLALLRKAEADYAAAHQEIQEGRRLSESPYVGARHETAYDLAEVAVLLSEASSADPGRRRQEQLAAAEALLHHLKERAVESDQPTLLRPLSVLSSQLYALKGDSERARAELRPLTQDVDPVTRARAYLGLSRLERIADLGADGRTRSLRTALVSAEQAVASLGAIAQGPAEPVYPSLTFQANSEAAWLLDALDRSGAAPMTVGRAGEGMTRFALETPPSWSDRAIERLEAAIRVAERPATENTRDNRGRSQFFTRYAPAYDLLVSQYVRTAARQAGTKGSAFSVTAGQPGYNDLLRAMEVSDLARNRTFRESVGVNRTGAPNAKGWLARRLRSLLRDDEVLLVYHLGGMRWQSGRRREAVGSDGEGTLFLVSDRGAKIACHRLVTRDGTGEVTRLSRSATADRITPYLALLSQPPRLRGDILTSHRRLALSCSEAVLPAAARKSLNPDRVSRLIIVPDGLLHQLPFEALMARDGRRSRFGVDWLPPIAYGPSLSVLNTLDRSGAAGVSGWGKVVSLGAPDYSGALRGPSQDSAVDRRTSEYNANTPRLTPLRHAEDEIAGVLQAFDSSGHATSVVKRTGPEATEAAFYRDSQDATVLHIAAHGFASRDETDVEAYLALTPPERLSSGHDGNVRLEELSAVTLASCELAILSACKTQVGADRPLEVGMSLTRALLEQNARRVVSSHWEVSDRATALLVPEFCRGLVRSGASATDYAAALREAKQRLQKGKIGGGDPARYSDPYYWAPLVLVGAR